MSEEKEKWWRIDNPLMWAVLASTFFLSLLIYLGSIPTCNLDLFPEAGDCPPKWRHIQVAPVNEVGDTLAGIAGVFAFIWLVATVLLQAHELGEQRKEFREQRKATQDMARSLSAQAKIFEEEQLQRSQTQAADLLFEKLKSLLNFVGENKSKHPQLTSYIGDFLVNVTDSGNERDLCWSLCESLERTLHSSSFADDFLTVSAPLEFKGLIEGIYIRVLEILDLESRLSDVQRQRILNLKLKEIKENSSHLLNGANWKEI